MAYSYPTIIQIAEYCPVRLSVTSTKRNGSSDYHDYGLAVDFAALYSTVPKAEADKMMRDAAQWWYQYSSFLLELIHTTPFDTDSGFYVKNRQKVGEGFYGPATNAAHLDHVHVAMTEDDANRLLRKLQEGTKMARDSAPSALLTLSREAPRRFGGVSSGIVGDAAHTYGYHRGRNFVSSSDYSNRLPLDKLGNGNHASAWDWNLNPTQMKLYTKRLLDAMDRRDPRMFGVREVYGTTNGTTVNGRIKDVEVGPARFQSSDNSHLWHIHIGFFRKHCNNPAAVAALMSVLAGEPLNPVKPVEPEKPAENVYEKVSNMILAQGKDSGHFYVGDGVHRRRILTTDDLNNTKAVLRTMKLSDTVNVWDDATLPALGELVNEDPDTPPVLTAPTLRSTGSSRGSVTVAWTAVGGATFYRVSRGPAPYDSYDLPDNRLTMEYRGLTPNTKYTFSVRAVRKNEDGTEEVGPGSNVITAATQK